MPVSVLSLALAATLAAASPPPEPIDAAPAILQDGETFRDLDRNGRLDPYEDHRLDADRRVADLLSRMTLEEKAGAVMHGTAPTPQSVRGGLGVADVYDVGRFESLNRHSHISSVITRLSAAPEVLAAQNNALQHVASGSRLGIPVTISTDPRNHFQRTDGASLAALGFSQWPEPLGLAALNDTEIVRRFGDAARREYRAVGIHMALSPQADLATEPRWSRINGTFGEDPDRAGRMVQAYVVGFQGAADGLRPDGVAAVVKHWVGYGAAPEGWDGHNHYGRFSRLGDTDLGTHIQPFLGAFAAGVAGVMPTYNILQGVTLDGAPIEPVGAGFNRGLLTTLLRDRYGFNGLVVSDWAITNDCGDNCRTGATPHGFGNIAMPWGVEDITETERFAKGMNAGVDQFGGTEQTDRMVEAVRQGLVPEARLDQAVGRVLRLKFDLGLFDHPFVDPAVAAGMLADPARQAMADEVQRRAMVMLENRLPAPVSPGARVYLHGVAPEAARAVGLLPVDTPEAADLALFRLAAPFETPHPNFFFGSRQHEGSLDFPADDAALADLRRAAAVTPTIVSVYLDRPAVLTQVKPLATVLIGEFGASDAAVLDVVLGRARAEGTLPFALPASMDQVRAQDPARPDDLGGPLYPLGYAWTGQAGAHQSSSRSK
ncbi:glycoside hydrolase family 3 protein [Brevundimonas sp.]|uniref:glycoside hydrolase family 3 protein n=1 Tax=Brevundimonas sp. TaxID=1871086 RepID=UPI0028B13C26|nr:glycoside hydrolase family 3 N-terminal domain-containing protein [Brevundimonas sp.]